jgi:hypothetical protein
MKSRENSIPFSQRSGLSPVPPQLAIGEVSAEFRRLIDYSIYKEIERFERGGFDHNYFDERWKEVATDLHVRFFGKPVASFENTSYSTRQSLEIFVARATIGPLFDLVEFFLNHPKCSAAFTSDLSSSFVSARAAYRVVDRQIVAVGTREGADSFEAAISETEVVGAVGARHHLIASASALRNGSWADSIRESIHAVEAMARRIEPNSTTLGPALKALEKNGYIHGSLRAGFDKLYGYTNDEGGIRHALLEDEAQVDETDALFMLGACASFVSYLISRDTPRV